VQLLVCRIVGQLEMKSFYSGSQYFALNRSLKID